MFFAIRRGSGQCRRYRLLADEVPTGLLGRSEQRPVLALGGGGDDDPFSLAYVFSLVLRQA